MKTSRYFPPAPTAMRPGDEAVDALLLPDWPDLGRDRSYLFGRQSGDSPVANDRLTHSGPVMGR